MHLCKFDHTHSPLRESGVDVNSCVNKALTISMPHILTTQTAQGSEYGREIGSLDSCFVVQLCFSHTWFVAIMFLLL